MIYKNKPKQKTHNEHQKGTNPIVFQKYSTYHHFSWCNTGSQIFWVILFSAKVIWCGEYVEQDIFNNWEQGQLFQNIDLFLLNVGYEVRDISPWLCVSHSFWVHHFPLRKDSMQNEQTFPEGLGLIFWSLERKQWSSSLKPLRIMLFLPHRVYSDCNHMRWL